MTWWWYAGGRLWRHSIHSKMTIKCRRSAKQGMKIASGPPGFSSLFMTYQNRADHTFWPHLQKNKQKMKTGWITHSWNNAIWLALRPCHMTMTHKINKLEKPGGPQGNFHASFGRSPTFCGHFRADILTSEWSTRISSSPFIKILELHICKKTFEAFWR